jgi:hypothetical protein
MLTYAETMLPMTGRTTSKFFVGGSIGSVFLPWIIGRYVEAAGPVLIIRILFGTLTLAGLMFLVLLRQAGKRTLIEG